MLGSAPMYEGPRICAKCGAEYAAGVIFCPKDGAPLGSRRSTATVDPYVDLVLGGQFAVEQLVGIGATGRVYRARQKGMDRDVAVKIVHRELMVNEQLIARFHREAKVASRLAHPNIVQVLMTGEVERSAGPDAGGEAYLVMEYLDGLSLRSALSAAGDALPLPRALHVMLQACDAVGEAHAQGIVHRDLKPENVMLVRRGDDDDFVKVLDFGVARMEGVDGTFATATGVIFGTARYISPEGAEGGPATARSDVYSLATMLFECLAGRTPFDADNPVGILLKHASEPAPPLLSIGRASYVPGPIARVVDANLVKNPAERARNAREFGRELIRAASASGLSADDLVPRSTLLGSRRGPLQLSSLERTKALPVGPELAAKLAPGATLETGGADPAEATPPVEATLSDEPLPSAPRGSGPPPGVPSSPESGRPSWDSLGPTGSFPPPRPTSEARRWGVIAACFAGGVLLSLLSARALGVFEEAPVPDAASYERRARDAMKRRAWNAPKDDNVLDITTSALARWPNAAPILAVRRDAAETVADEARSRTDTDVAEAERLSRLAIELDPGNEKARALLASLTSGDAQGAGDAMHADAEPRSRAPRGGHRAPSPSATAPPPLPDAGAVTPVPSPSAGRWL